MSKPLSFYQEEKSKFEQQRDQLRKKSNLYSILRIILFLIVLPAAYLSYDETRLFLGVLATGFTGFMIMVIKHQSLRTQRILSEHLIAINSIEIDALNGKYDSLPTGSEFTDPHHYFSNDVDLFGNGSFFQYINRTATSSGRRSLARILTSNDIEDIAAKQEVIKELSEMPQWRQRYLALAKMVKTETDHKIIVSWIHNYKSFLPSLMKYLPMLFSLISLVLLLLVSLGQISFFLLAGWFFVGLLITLPYFKRVNHLYLEAGQIKHTFKQYHTLLNEIENLKLKASFAIKQQDKIQSSNKKASLIFKEFSKILDAFDQRNNMLFGILGNGLFLWDLRQTYKIDKWISVYQNQVENWFDVISYFDAQISLSNYAYNHTDHHFPEIKLKEYGISAEMLGHPLLDKEVRIDNDFSIAEKDFQIITGANMAGKSTFLRTISLSLIMSNSGLPVCAKKMSYSPIKLITSMRTTDSLAEESSYFYAEIVRLRFIVDQMKDDKYFIILDEILKGTNSKDKAIGSKKFVEKLVKSGSTGIIATHDLSLCDIEQEYPQIHNKYFDAKINNEELVFDYKLKAGICTNMNASFLLKKMEII
ncbi:DNA mismatch repair protein MutS [Lutimonas halocynthiae]|uniref:MutS-related protein n=1 Tax=Lutimonas halocynthiae TaxID=1446477 RepID=UPI0025B2B116|nr:DNA mismatch repair protein MutS [Lutimonas halocynthiae]MDN3641273.1 DNA mismatch repair protein MutS [Lutimonas halocynthiae]